MQIWSFLKEDGDILGIVLAVGTLKRLKEPA